MISKPEVMPLLVAACPSFAPQWQAFLKQWRDAPYGLPLGIAMQQLAQHVVGMLERGDTVAFPDIFGVVERLQSEGDDDARSMGWGLLQMLMDAKSYQQASPDGFTPYLGAMSSRCWHALQDLRRRLKGPRCVNFNDWGMGCQPDVRMSYLPWDEIVAISALAIVHPKTNASFTIVGFYGQGRALEVDQDFDGWSALLDGLPEHLAMASGWRDRLAAFRHGDAPPLLFKRGPLPEWVRCASGLKDD